MTERSESADMPKFNNNNNNNLENSQAQTKCEKKKGGGGCVIGHIDVDVQKFNLIDALYL